MYIGQKVVGSHLLGPCIEVRVPLKIHLVRQPNAHPGNQRRNLTWLRQECNARKVESCREYISASILYRSAECRVKEALLGHAPTYPFPIAAWNLHGFLPCILARSTVSFRLLGCAGA